MVNMNIHHKKFRKLCFVSSNSQKALEVQMILELPVYTKSIELKELQSMDIEEVVRQKATDAFAQTKKPVIVDDVGLYIQAWNGFPGPFVKHLISSGGCNLLWKMMHEEKNRN